MEEYIPKWHRELQIFDKIKPIEDNHKVSRKSGMIFFILSSVLCSIFIYLLKHM